MWSNYAGAGDALRFVRVGTLDEPDRLPPDIHIYTASKQPWVLLPPGVPAVPEYYSRREHWPAESLERRGHACTVATTGTRAASFVGGEAFLQRATVAARCAVLVIAGATRDTESRTSTVGKWPAAASRRDSTTWPSRIERAASPMGSFMSSPSTRTV